MAWLMVGLANRKKVGLSEVSLCSVLEPNCSKVECRLTLRIAMLRAERQTQTYKVYVVSCDDSIEAEAIGTEKL